MLLNAQPVSVDSVFKESAWRRLRKCRGSSYEGAVNIREVSMEHRKTLRGAQDGRGT